MFPATPFLSEAELRAAGIPAPWIFGRRDWVRPGEVDALSHVNNTVYLQWFETVRVAYVRDLRPSPYPAQSTVLKSLTAEYHAEMRRDEAYVVTARTTSFRNTSFVQEYALFAPDLRASGTAVVVLVDSRTGEKTPLSDALRDLLIRRDGAEDLRG